MQHPTSAATGAAALKWCHVAGMYNGEPVTRPLQGVTVVDAASYFRSHWSSCAEVADLFDSLTASAEVSEAAGGEQRGLPPHLSVSALEAGVDSGVLLQVRGKHDNSRCCTNSWEMILTTSIWIAVQSNQPCPRRVAGRKAGEEVAALVLLQLGSCSTGRNLLNLDIQIHFHLSQGVIHMSRRGPREASVQVGSGSDAISRRVLISGRAAVNRAMHGDTVAIRLLPRCGKRVLVIATVVYRMP